MTTAHQVIKSQLWLEGRSTDQIAADIISALQHHGLEIRHASVARQPDDGLTFLDWGGADIDTSNTDEVAEWAWSIGWNQGWNVCADSFGVDD